MTRRAEALHRVGIAAFGEDWQRAMARALGPLHPDGPREHIDDRLVRRWASGERDVPSWVMPALPLVLEQTATRFTNNAEVLRALAAELIASEGRDGSQGSAEPEQST